jgi:hypothetical protein
MWHAGQWVARAVVAALVVSAASVASAQTSVVTATWDANTDGQTSGYMVYYGTSTGAYQWSYDAGNQTSAQLTLTRGATYYFSVRGYNSSAQLGPGSTEATIAIAATVTAPTATITASLQNASTALVSWQTTDAASATLNGVAVAASGSTTFPVNATTTYTIVATGSTGLTATSSATVNVVAPPPVTAPTATITASLQNASTALVSWQTTDAASATLNGVAVAASGSTTFTVNATTTFTIVATGSTGLTATSSATVNVVAPPPPSSPVPNAPTGMATSVTNSRVRFSWRAPSGTAPSTYLVDVGISGTSRMVASAYPVGNVLSVAADLPKGRYWTRVRAGNAAGVSGYSNFVSFKVGRSLISPQGFTVTWIGTTAVLTWSAPAADGAVEDVPTAYVLEAGTAPGLTDVATVNLGNVKSLSVPIPSGTYYVRLRAENPYGDSEPTPDLVLVPPGAPQAPTSFMVSRVNGTAHLRWNAPAGPSVEGYVLEVGSAPELTDITRVDVGNVTQFSAPAPAGTYYIRVRARNARGPGLPSNEAVLR